MVKRYDTSKMSKREISLRRKEAVINLIKSKIPGYISQAEIARDLEECGFKGAQRYQVSRILKSLRSTFDGNGYITLRQQVIKENDLSYIKRYAKEIADEVSILVVKCEVGHAKSIATLLRSEIKEIIGEFADGDTVILITKDKDRTTVRDLVIKTITKDES